MLNQEIELIYYNHGVDSEGFTTLTEVAVPIFAEALSVTRNELVASMQTDQKPVIIFYVLPIDYDLVKHIVDGRPKYAEAIRYEGCLYNFIKDFHDVKKGLTEITCG